MDIKQYEEQMQKRITYFSGRLAGLQVWRATTSLVENIDVETEYGTMKMNGIALITVSDNSTLKIEPWDKGNSKHIANAIYNADLWVWVDNQWSFLFITIPPLTQERREEIAKQVKATWEDTKANIRKIRQDAMNETKWELAKKEISEDQHKANESEVEDLTKKMNGKIDELVKSKVDEVLKK